jgi:aspartyl-tRNA(Asn)/glutamyl-tRNA(Gln) amidotransferase subunit C
MDITHVAKLARIGLKDDELKKMELELSAILGFVEKLKGAEIENVKPMAGGTSLFNIVRDDELRPTDPNARNRILDNFPKRKGDYIEIPPVFE